MEQDLGNKVFDFLKGLGLGISIYNNVGDETVDPEEGVRFQSDSPNILVTIDKENNELKLSKSKDAEGDIVDRLHKGIKNLANDHLFDFDYKIFGKAITSKFGDFKSQINIKKEIDDNMNMTEASLGKMYGSVKTSYQPLDSVKIVVRHGKPVNEEVRGSRSRAISKLFIQKGDERFALPHTSLAGARAMARHMYNGGTPFDTVGTSINEMVENVESLSKFVRYVENRNLVNEDNSKVVTLAKESMYDIRSTLKKLSGAKSYAKAVEALDYSTAFELSEDDNSLEPLFTETHIDNNVVNAFPVINKLLNVQNKLDEYIADKIKTIKITAPIAEEAIEYSSRTAEIAHKLSIISEFIDDKLVKNFVENCSTKILKGYKLDEKSLDNIKTLISKTNTINEIKDKKELSEFIDFTRKLNNIVED